MMSYFEAQVGMLNFAGPSGMERAQRIHATVRWVRAACERDGYPTWLVDMVIERVQRDLLAGDFPLVEVGSDLGRTSASVLPPPDPGFENIITQGALGRKPPPGRPNPMPTSGGYRLRPSDLSVVRGREPGTLERVGVIMWSVAVGIAAVVTVVLTIASHVSMR